VLERLSDQEIERHIPALRRFAMSLARNSDDADDLVQDALLKAVSRWAQLRRRDSVRAWLFQILYNLHRARLRSRHPVFDDIPSDTSAAHPIGVERSDQRLELQSALRALAALPDDQRLVLELVVMEGFSYEATARIIGVPLGTVMSRLSRARDKIRDQLEGRAPTQLRIVK
jgi:RNA polymerase sigma-70 factor, ECF subfamily